VGSSVTYHAVDAYKNFNVVAMFIDPANPARTFVDTVKIDVKPAPAYRLFIEPYTAAISPVPNPVDSLVILATETQKEIAAVVRYKLGNFFRFDTSVTWESGYSGIVQVRTPDKPYICRVERVANVEKGNSGTTFVLCKKDGLTIATVRVVVRSAIIYAKCLERLPVFHTPGAAKKEFYNLRGQKLPLYGIRHTDGIVLERIIEPSEKASIRKIVPEIKSR
jgi:hypothetical protein